MTEGAGAPYAISIGVSMLAAGLLTAPAAGAVLLGFLLLVAGLVWVVVPPMVDEFSTLGDTIEDGTTTNTIGLGGVVPSKLVLPVIPGEDAQGTPLPEPTALRGEPSRTYEPAANGG